VSCQEKIVVGIPIVIWFGEATVVWAASRTLVLALDACEHNVERILLLALLPHRELHGGDFVRRWLHWLDNFFDRRKTLDHIGKGDSLSSFPDLTSKPAPMVGKEPGSLDTKLSQVRDRGEFIETVLLNWYLNEVEGFSPRPRWRRNAVVGTTPRRQGIQFPLGNDTE
jgi:hypothetical protein